VKMILRVSAGYSGSVFGLNYSRFSCSWVDVGDGLIASGSWGTDVAWSGTDLDCVSESWSGGWSESDSWS